jgi:hypothetical protein
MAEAFAGGLGSLRDIYPIKMIKCKINQVNTGGIVNCHRIFGCIFLVGEGLGWGCGSAVDGVGLAANTADLGY